jgi:Tfp pilus assembly protein PilO
MQWELIVALVIAIPVILFPAAYIWFINIGGIYAAIKEARQKKVTVKKEVRATTTRAEHN